MCMYNVHVVQDSTIFLIVITGKCLNCSQRFIRALIGGWHRLLHCFRYHFKTPVRQSVANCMKSFKFSMRFCLFIHCYRPFDADIAFCEFKQTISWNFCLIIWNLIVMEAPTISTLYKCTVLNTFQIHNCLYARFSFVNSLYFSGKSM